MSGNIPDNIDLKSARIQANLTQSDLAKRLNVAQSQILRYEAEPENVPVRIVREWMTACGSMNPGSGADYGKPFVWKRQCIADLIVTRSVQPVLQSGDTAQTPIGIEDMLNAIEQLGRKPRVVLSGRFDAGKSRLANTLLGSNSLPTAYQPATRIICLIRHISDKPDWQTEDVWITDDTLLLENSQNKDECIRTKLIAGGLETLQRYATHGGDVLAGTPGCALIYLDSPILHACDLLDSPGLSPDENDKALAGAASAYGDAVIYLSPFMNFLNGEDISAIGTLTEMLPPQPGVSPLRGLSILATHAHPGISEQDVQKALATGADRLFKEFQPFLKRRNQAEASDITRDHIRERLFPWYVELSERRAPFESDLQTLLTTIMPNSIRKRVNKVVSQIKNRAKILYGNEVAEARALLEQYNDMDILLSKLLDAEPERKKRTAQKADDVRKFINKSRLDAVNFVKSDVAPLFREDMIRKVIESRFRDSKDAEENAGNYLVSLARGAVETFTTRQSKHLSDLVETLLNEYALELNTDIGVVFVPFDAKAAFLGGLAASGVFGGLAIWAAVVAGGSNLGAYLLIPEIVGLLSAVGISIAGGTVGAISTVSALGGPVGLGIGIAIAAGMIAWQIFGRSWQSRLAKGLAEAVAKRNVEGKILTSCEAYWSQTREGFDAAISSTEEKHYAYLQRLKQQVTELTPPQIEARKARLEARAAFMSVIPWPEAEI